MLIREWVQHVKEAWTTQRTHFGSNESGAAPRSAKVASTNTAPRDQRRSLDLGPNASRLGLSRRCAPVQKERTGPLHGRVSQHSPDNAAPGVWKARRQHLPPRATPARQQFCSLAETTRSGSEKLPGAGYIHNETTSCSTRDHYLVYVAINDEEVQFKNAKRKRSWRDGDPCMKKPRRSSKRR